MLDDPAPDIIYWSVYLVLTQRLKEEVDQPQSLFLARNLTTGASVQHGCTGLAGKEQLSQCFCACARVRGSRDHPGLPEKGDTK